MPQPPRIYLDIRGDLSRRDVAGFPATQPLGSSRRTLTGNLAASYPIIGPDSFQFVCDDGKELAC